MASKEFLTFSKFFKFMQQPKEQKACSESKKAQPEKIPMTELAEGSEEESIKSPFTDSESNSDISFDECSDGDKDYLPTSSHETDTDEEREPYAESQWIVEDSMDSISSVVFPFLQQASSSQTSEIGDSTNGSISVTVRKDNDTGVTSSSQTSSEIGDGTDGGCLSSSVRKDNDTGVTSSSQTSSEIRDGTDGGCLSSSVRKDNDTGVAQKWDKHHSCLFCNKNVIKMSAHLEKMHSEEPAVIKVLMLGKGTAERRRQWSILLNEGDFQHNVHVLKTGFGNLIKKYRSKNHEHADYVACPHCKAMNIKTLLATHAKSCSLNKGLNAKKGEAVLAGRMLMPVPSNVSESFYRNVMEKMKDDDVRRLILHDSLLLRFGERSFNSRDIEEHTYGHISGRLRELGRLLSCLRKNTNMKVSNLTQALHVRNFDELLKAVKNLAEFDESSHRFHKGSLALKIGYSLKKATRILKADSLKSDDIMLQKQANDFEILFSGDWYDYISASASQSIYRARQNNRKLLPACSDIELLHHLLEKKLHQTTDYATIAKATLCMITLFNRKRGGEVQRMKVEDFQNGMLNGSTTNPETIRNLTESEKKLLEFFSRVEIRGKFNRVVPILLTSQMIRSIRDIIDLRKTMSPSLTSPYLFISKTGSRPYRGSDVIREFIIESGVKDPSLFTFTNLRKQIATLSQTIEISKWEQDQLATFLGHDIRVHINIYRQPIDVLDRAKVAKILLTANKGMSISSNQSFNVDDGDLLEEGSDHENSDDENEDEEADVQEEVTAINDIDVASTSQKKPVQCLKSLSNHKKFNRKVWSQIEVDAVKRNMGYCIAMGRVPRKDEAEKTLASEPVLKNRNWKNIKDFVYNLVKKSKRS